VNVKAQFNIISSVLSHELDYLGLCFIFILSNLTWF